MAKKNQNENETSDPMLDPGDGSASEPGTTSPFPPTDQQPVAADTIISAEETSAVSGPIGSVSTTYPNLSDCLPNEGEGE
jgi:hypothetical protein